jgi:hypothetical protein
VIGKSEGKIQLGRRRSRWEDDIKTNLEERDLKGVNRFHLAEVRDKCGLL